MREFASGSALAAALADAVAGALRARLAAHRGAVLAVSGGTTPLSFFAALRTRVLDWARVTVTLVDDRCVAADQPRSNARLVRETLLREHAANAAFQPLLGADEAAIGALARPFAAVVLGMGIDGHTASYFPGGDRLSSALAGPHMLERIIAPGADEPRITLTWPILASATFLALHIEGAAKRVALDAARAPGPIAAMPVRIVLARTPPPEIFWCP